MVWISETGQLNPLPKAARKQQGKSFLWLGHGREIRNRATRSKNLLLRIYVHLQNLASSEQGQDLVEYALVVALIAFGCTAAMSSLASGISSAFTNVSSALSTNIT
jgi:pilus assembly protein Flp/PilA